MWVLPTHILVLLLPPQNNALPCPDRTFLSVSHSLLILVRHLIHLSLVVICVHHMTWLVLTSHCQCSDPLITLVFLGPWKPSQLVTDFAWKHTHVYQRRISESRCLKYPQSKQIPKQQTNILLKSKNKDKSILKAILAWTHAAVSLASCHQTQEEATPSHWISIISIYIIIISIRIWIIIRNIIRIIPPALLL